MDLKLARTGLDIKPKSINFDKIQNILEKEEQKIFYFDKENSHKQLLSMIEHFENQGFSVYHRSLKYGLDENDYVYEVHIL